MSLEEERTRQKLRFARLHLDELSSRTLPPPEAMTSRGRTKRPFLLNFLVHMMLSFMS
jgi:hypothetical protein